MSMYKSVPRKHGSVIQPGETAGNKRDEFDEQYKFGVWMSKNYPQIMFRTDLSSGANKSRFMRSRARYLKSNDSFPDIEIYYPSGGYIGLMIEMKAVGKGAFLQSGELSQSEHIQEQHRCHEKLRAQGWFVCFAVGCEGAKEAFQRYINDPFDPNYLLF